MKYFVSKQFVNQHLVLEKIYNVPSVREFPNVQELANSLQLSEDDVMQAAHLLKGRGFANVNREKRPFVISCTPDGAQALLQRAILDEGREKAKANLLRWMQIAGIVVASTISVGTFLVNILSTIRNANDIEMLKLDINSLKRDAAIERLRITDKSLPNGKKQRLK